MSDGSSNQFREFVSSIRPEAAIREVTGAPGPRPIRRGGGGGGGRSNREQEPTPAPRFESDLLKQSFSSQAELNAAETQFKQQQAQKQSSQQAQREQRQSIVGRGSGVTPSRFTPKQFGQAEASKVEPKTFRDRTEQAKIVYAQQGGGVVGAFQGGVTLARTTVSDIRARREERRQAAFERRVKSVGGKLVQDESIKVVEGTDLPGATAQNIRYKETPKEVLLRDAALGDRASLEAARRQTQKEIDEKARVVATEELNKDQAVVDKFAREAQGRINRGESTVEKETERLGELSSKLDSDRQERVKAKVESKVKESQKELDSAAKKGRITRLVVTTAGTVIAGAALSPAVAILPRGVQTGIAVASAGGVAIGGTRLEQRFKAGEAGALDVAEFAAPLIGFAVGAGIYARAAKVDPKQFRRAIQTAKLEPSKVRAITTEVQVKMLNLPANQEAQLIEQVRGGRRVSIQTFELKNSDPKLQRVIDKVIPSRSITQASFIDVNGNSISGRTFTRVSVGKGATKHVEIQGAIQAGRVDLESGKAVVDTVNIRTTGKGRLIDISKTRTDITADVRNIRDSTTKDIIERLVRTKSLTRRGITLKPDPNKPIKFEDLSAVAESDIFSKAPSFKSTQVEAQRVTSRTAEAAQKGDLSIIRQKAILNTIEATGANELVSKPIVEFERQRGGSFRKIPETKSPSVDIKPTKVQEKILKETQDAVSGGTMKQSQFKRTAIEFEPLDFKSGINQKSEIVRGISERSKTITSARSGVSTRPTAGLDFNQISLNRLKSRLNTSTDSTSINIKSTLRESQFQPSLSNSALRSGQLSTQLNKLNNSFNTLSPPPGLTDIPIPQIPSILFPGVPSRSSGFQKANKKLEKKLLKRRPQYAASLAAAAVQRSPTKVTRKQFEKLQRATFTGAEVRPVLQVINEPVRAVQF